MPSSGLPTLYHVSPRRFDSVDISASRARLLEMVSGENLDKSPNGSLGFWVSPYPSCCAAFGPEVARIEIDPQATLIGMSVRQLRRSFWEPVADLDPVDVVHAHARLGDELARLGDILLITDGTERVGEVVILNEDVILGLDWDCGVDLDTHVGQDVRTDSLTFDVEASSALARWHFDESGEMIKNDPAKRLRL